MAVPEMSRRVELAEVDKKPQKLNIDATSEERSALAERLGVVALDALQAQVTVQSTMEHWYSVTGRLEAQVVQSCVRSLEPVPETIQVPVSMTLTTAPEMADDDEAVELSSGDDLERITGDSVDVGELLIQLLSVSLNPYPKREDASAPDMEGVQVFWDSESTPDEPTHRPFANLAQLLKK